MVVARRFLQVMVAAGMVVGTIVASNGGEDKAPAETDDPARWLRDRSADLAARI